MLVRIGENRTLVCYWWKCKLASHYGKRVWSILKKTQKYNYHVTQLLGIYQKEKKDEKQQVLVRIWRKENPRVLLVGM